jgi:hypothetical protein
MQVSSIEVRYEIDGEMRIGYIHKPYHSNSYIADVLRIKNKYLSPSGLLPYVVVNPNRYEYSNDKDGGYLTYNEGLVDRDIILVGSDVYMTRGVDNFLKIKFLLNEYRSQNVDILLTEINSTASRNFAINIGNYKLKICEKFKLGYSITVNPHNEWVTSYFIDFADKLADPEFIRRIEEMANDVVIIFGRSYSLAGIIANILDRVVWLEYDGTITYSLYGKSVTYKLDKNTNYPKYIIGNAITLILDNCFWGNRVKSASNRISDA